MSTNTIVIIVVLTAISLAILFMYPAAIPIIVLAAAVGLILKKPILIPMIIGISCLLVGVLILSAGPGLGKMGLSLTLVGALSLAIYTALKHRFNPPASSS